MDMIFGIAACLVWGPKRNSSDYSELQPSMYYVITMNRCELVLNLLV